MNRRFVIFKDNNLWLYEVYVKGTIVNSTKPIYKTYHEALGAAEVYFSNYMKNDNPITTG